MERANQHHPTLKHFGTPTEALRRVAGLTADYPRSLWGGWREHTLLADLHAFCLFIGYPYSGHSLIGALLDAHPNVILANEQHVLRYVRAGFSREQILYLLSANERRCAAARAQGHLPFYYNFQVPNQWNGAVSASPQVIGDKGAWGATLALERQPRLLERLHRLIRVEVKIVHVVRNPYDSIARFALRQQVDLAQALSYHFRLAHTIAGMVERIPAADLLELHHEDFLAAPAPGLAKLCTFLGLKAPNDYLEDCTSIVFSAPHKSRYEVAWDDNLRQEVQDQSARFAFLAGYAFDD